MHDQQEVYNINFLNKFKNESSSIDLKYLLTLLSGY